MEYLFSSSLTFFITVLSFFSYRSSIYFIRFIPIYFFGSVNVSGIYFLDFIYFRERGREGKKWREDTDM